MAIKVETRGKYAGVKIHLDAEESEELIKYYETFLPNITKGVLQTLEPHVRIARKMGKQIKALLVEDPNLLKERTPEQIAAILAKDHEKTAMQLNQLKSGQKWQKVDQEKLKTALLKHVEG